MEKVTTFITFLSLMILLFIVIILLYVKDDNKVNKTFKAYEPEYAKILKTTKGFENCSLLEIPTKVTIFNEPIDTIQIVKCPNSTTHTQVMNNDKKVKTPTIVITK